jgi:hypothetical protein
MITSNFFFCLQVLVMTTGLFDPFFKIHYQRLLRATTLISGLVTPFQIRRLLNISGRMIRESSPRKDLEGSCHDLV